MVETGARWEIGHIGHMAISRHALIRCMCLKVMVLPHISTILYIKNQWVPRDSDETASTCLNTKYKGNFFHLGLTYHFIQVALELLGVVVCARQIWSCVNSRGVGVFS